MERKTRDDQLCWTDCHEPWLPRRGTIDGTYLDYLVDNIMSIKFQISSTQYPQMISYLTILNT